MSIDQTHTLILNTADELLPQLLQQHGWTMETVQSLKDYSAQFYFSDSSQALSIAQSAHRLSQLLPFPAPALGEWTLANALSHHALYQQAVIHFQFAHAEFTDAGLYLDAARLSVGYIPTLAYIGQSEVALQMGKQAEPLLHTAGQNNVADQHRLAGLLLNMGVIYERLGQYEEAIELNQRLEPLAVTLADPLLLAQAQHNQAYDLAQISAFDRALALYQRAEEGFLQQDALEDAVRLYINRSNLHAFLGHYNQALATQDKAEQTLTRLSSSSQAHHRLTLLRAQVTLFSNHHFAPSLFDQLAVAQESFQQNGPLIEACLSLILQGKGYLRSDRFLEAQRCFEAVSKLPGALQDQTIQYRILHGLGQIAYATKHFAQAIQYYQQATGAIESIRSTLHIEGYRAAFMRDKLEVYQDLAQVLLEQSDAKQAFAAVEQAKSRLVAEKLVWRLSLEANTAANSEDGETRLLAQQLQSSLKKLDTLYSVSNRQNADSTAATNPTAVALETAVASSFFENETQVFKQNTAQLETEVEHLLHRIQRRNPHFAVATMRQTTGVDDLASQLNNSCFLQYHRIANHYYAFIVDHSGIQVHVKLGTVEAVQNRYTLTKIAIERVLELIVKLGLEKVARYSATLLADINQHLLAFHALLFQPLRPWLPADAALIVSPYGLLHYIPFHALYDGQRYLIEDYVISYSPSATVLTLCQQTRAKGESILLCGHDDGRLRAVASELARTAHILAAYQPTVDAKATVESVLTLFPHNQLIHIAAHSSFRADNPMLSSLSLFDRRLTLAEIVQLQLSANLVVLSGCETGNGQLQGDDLISLASGFLGAGARSLLISLWSVEDEATALLMESFYSGLVKGHSCAKALQTAQVALLKHGRNQADSTSLYRHPAFWAAFVLLGDPATFIQNPSLDS